ncbi:DNA mismatch repair protein MutS [Rhizobiales bacterium GAS191]|nr:DNA mismatch repair protein MutS [Rhizobiales bacterium GAS191]
MHAPSSSTSPPLKSDHVTPVMAQFVEIKAANPDCLLFYRMGDFYELFFEDAEIASRALGIVLTKRGRHHGVDIPMCGVPVHRADEYLQRLIALGHRVGVCEQLEDSAEARKRGSKSVVRRDVTRLVTPGTITEEALLDPSRANTLLAIARVRASDGGWVFGLAALDISTGSFALSEAGPEGLAAEIARFDPREIILPETVHEDPELASLWSELRAPIVPQAREGLDAGTAASRLAAYFEVASVEAFGQFSRAELAAGGGAIAYVERTQRGARPPLSIPVREGKVGVMRIDAATRANLELARTLNGERAGSLLSVIDRSATGAGARLLAERLASPLIDPAAIDVRLDAVAYLVERPELRADIRVQLRRIPDMLRAVTRLSLDRGGPRDMAAIGQALDAAHALSRMLAGSGLAGSAELEAAQQATAGAELALTRDIEAALAEELPLLKRDGGFVREGYDASLDEIRALRDESRRVIAALQARYAQETDCRTLRVKHNNMLGFFVEVPQAAGERFLKEPLARIFAHRQTMAGAMRFSTVELGELESKIASAADKALSIELTIFDRLNAGIAAVRPTIEAVAHGIAIIDVAAALADLAADLGWVRPVVDNGLGFEISGGRHPVVEAALRRDGKSFVSNGCDLSPPPGEATGRIAIVTGPNMAGKSTYLRQNALIAVLAQSGSYVPAETVRIGVVDRLFSRVGAADDLARGRSTFMVEMIETAAILNQASERSLVILDEIGRGTATFDGLSIAWATLEHLHESNRCRALFATHFHELTALVSRLPRLINLTSRVREWRGDVVFLHEVVAGAADRSYGVQVARLAGLPASVIARSKAILAGLERTEREKPAARLIEELPLFAAAAAPQPAAREPPAEAHDALREALAGVNPDELTPREALDVLYRLKAAAAGKG